MFICVSALRYLGCVCLPETSSAAINTMFLEIKSLSVPFWYSFALLDDMFEQGDDFDGSPRALYGAWGV